MNVKIDHSQDKTLDALGGDFYEYKPKAEETVRKIMKAGLGEFEWSKSDAGQYIQENFSDSEILFMAVNHMSDMAEKHIKMMSLKSILGKLTDSDGAPDEDEFDSEIKKLLLSSEEAEVEEDEEEIG